MKDGKRAKVHNNQPKTIIYRTSRSQALCFQRACGQRVIIPRHEQVSNNVITGNDSAAIILTSYLDAIFGSFDDVSSIETPKAIMPLATHTVTTISRHSCPRTVTTGAMQR